MNRAALVAKKYHAGIPMSADHATEHDALVPCHDACCHISGSI
jgi:hypothetical protein